MEFLKQRRSERSDLPLEVGVEEVGFAAMQRWSQRVSEAGGPVRDYLSKEPKGPNAGNLQQGQQRVRKRLETDLKGRMDYSRLLDGGRREAQ